jgi:hypothetical protein
VRVLARVLDRNAVSSVNSDIFPPSVGTAAEISSSPTAECLQPRVGSQRESLRRCTLNDYGKVSQPYVQ